MPPLFMSDVLAGFDNLSVELTLDCSQKIGGIEGCSLALTWEEPISPGDW